MHVPVRGPVAPQGNGLEGKGEGTVILPRGTPKVCPGTGSLISRTLRHRRQGPSSPGSRILPWASAHWGRGSRRCSRSHGG